MYLVDSVFPAPDSPDTMMDCDCRNTFMSRKAWPEKNDALENDWNIDVVWREFTYSIRVTFL